MLAADPDVVRFSTYVRQGAIRFYLPLDVALPNDFFAQSVVVTKGLKERDQVRARCPAFAPSACSANQQKSRASAFFAVCRIRKSSSDPVFGSSGILAGHHIRKLQPVLTSQRDGLRLPFA